MRVDSHLIPWVALFYPKLKGILAPKTPAKGCVLGWKGGKGGSGKEGKEGSEGGLLGKAPGELASHEIHKRKLDQAHAW